MEMLHMNINVDQLLKELESVTIPHWMTMLCVVWG